MGPTRQRDRPATTARDAERKALRDARKAAYELRQSADDPKNAMTIWIRDSIIAKLGRRLPPRSKTDPVLTDKEWDALVRDEAQTLIDAMFENI